MYFLWWCCCYAPIINIFLARKVLNIFSKSGHFYCFALTGSARSHFEKEIWPDEKRKTISSTNMAL